MLRPSFQASRCRKAVLKPEHVNLKISCDDKTIYVHNELVSYQALHSKISEIFAEPEWILESFPLNAITPEMFILVDGWVFNDLDRIMGQGQGLGYTWIQTLGNGLVQNSSMDIEVQYMCYDTCFEHKSWVHMTYREGMVCSHAMHIRAFDEMGFGDTFKLPLKNTVSEHMLSVPLQGNSKIVDVESEVASMGRRAAILEQQKRNKYVHLG